MIEFEVFEAGGQRRTYVVQVNSIATITPAGTTGTLIVPPMGANLLPRCPTHAYGRRC